MKFRGSRNSASWGCCLTSGPAGTGASMRAQSAPLRKSICDVLVTHLQEHEHFGSVVDELMRVIAGRKQDEIPGTDLRQSGRRAHFRRSGNDQECLFGHVVLVKWVRFLSRRELPHTARDRLACQLLASLEIGAPLHPFTPRNIFGVDDLHDWIL